jgi:hypothetical protein
MKVKVQLVVWAEDGREERVQEVTILEKRYQQIEHFGLTLAEAKDIWKTLQQYLVEQQTAAFVAAHSRCDHCGIRLGIKAW